MTVFTHEQKLMILQALLHIAVTRPDRVEFPSDTGVVGKIFFGKSRAHARPDRCLITDDTVYCYSFRSNGPKWSFSCPGGFLLFGKAKQLRNALDQLTAALRAHQQGDIIAKLQDAAGINPLADGLADFDRQLSDS